MQATGGRTGVSEQLAIRGNGWLETVTICNERAHLRARDRNGFDRPFPRPPLGKHDSAIIGEEGRIRDFAERYNPVQTALGKVQRVGRNER